MGSIFISHSSKNAEKALQVRDWLLENGWDDVFLDLDPARGLVPGQRWQDELRYANERCIAVVVLVSPEWAASKWCLSEFLLAMQLGKLIFPIIVKPTPFEELPVELIAQFQLADISNPANEAEGFDRFAMGLRRAGLDPSFFPWPPPQDPARSPFRGLAVLEEIDAALIFGRDESISRGLDSLRRIRDFEAEQGLVIVGGSGVGKSSFLRAGLLARLRRDTENFCVLDAIRPTGQVAGGFEGLVRAFEVAFRQAGGAAAAAGNLASACRAHNWHEVLSQIRTPLLKRLPRNVATEGKAFADRRAPTIVIAIDQGEELLSGDPDIAHLVEALRILASPENRCLLVLTLRSASFAAFNEQEVLGSLKLATFLLPPLRLADFREVIVGPGALARPSIDFAPELVSRLQDDLLNSDALPMLALTMQQLYLTFRDRGRRIELADYLDGIGGLHAIISRAGAQAVRSVLGQGADDRSQVETLLAATFIPLLVTIDAISREPSRRIADRSKLPASAQPLVTALLAARLLTENSGQGSSQSHVQIVHEAVFRQWPELANVIELRQDSLIRLDSIRRSATEWDNNDRNANWLEHRDQRLVDALSISGEASLGQALDGDARDYLDACRLAQSEREADERARLESERRNFERTRKLQKLSSALLFAIAAIVLITGLGALRMTGAQAQRTSEEIARKAEDWQMRGFPDRAARLALAASQPPLPLVGFDPSAAQSALANTLGMVKVQTILQGHAGFVLDAAFSPSGRFVASAGADGTVRLWDVEHAGDARVLVRRKSWAHALTFSSDGKLVAASFGDGHALVWDVANGTVVKSFEHAGSPMPSLAFDPSGTALAIASNDGTVGIWDLTSGSLRRQFHAQSAAATAIAFSPDGALLATGSEDRSIHIWAGDGSALRFVLNGHSSGISSIAFSRDGHSLASTSLDRTVRLWNLDARTSSELWRSDAALSSVRFAPDGEKLLIASQDGAASEIDLRSGTETERFTGHVGPVNTAAYSPDGKSIVTTGDDTLLRIWRPAPDLNISSEAKLLDFTFADSRGKVLASDIAGHIISYSPGSTNPGAIFDQGRAPVLHVSVSRDGRFAASASETGGITIWDLTLGQAVAVTETGESTVRALTFSPQTDLLAGALSNGQVAVWTVPTGKLRSSFNPGVGSLMTVLFSPTTNLLAVGGVDEAVGLWDVDRNVAVRSFKGHTSNITSLAFSGDGTRLASASTDHSVRLWNVDSGQPAGVFKGHTMSVVSVSLSPDGRLLASASEDHTVRIWRIDGAGEIARMTDYVGTPRSVKFSPDGQSLATLSQEGLRLRPLGHYVDQELQGLRGSKLRDYVCERYLARGSDRVDALEKETLQSLTVAQRNGVCQPVGWFDYFRYAFGLS